MTLFKDFQTLSSKQWKQKIQMDLKGTDYKTLVHQTKDAIIIKPFYHKDNYKSLEITNKNATFLICQSIFIASEKIAINIAKNALNKGANAIEFIAKKPFNLKKIIIELSEFKTIKINFKIGFLDNNFNKEILKHTNKKNIIFEIDSINNLAESGNWFSSKDADFKQIKATNSLSIQADLYQNAGANNVQQIAYGLAHLNEYLNENLISENKIINCTFSVGSNYFFEIAKLRAFRYLFNKLLKEYDLKCELNLIVKPSLRNKTIYDYNLNMLRTTTECMAAILGNANQISNVAYDSIYHKTNDFGERIARNQLIILQEESYFIEANTIANGSYYIEQITYELADKALKLFKDIEKNSGFINQLLKGTIQRKIEESAQKEQQQFDDEELILVGTNKFINNNDKMKVDLQLFPFVKNKPRHTIIKPIIRKRLAEKIEQKRLNKE